MMMMVVSIAYLLLGLVGSELGAYQSCAWLLVRLSNDAASLHRPINAVFILSCTHDLVMHANTCHHVLLAIICRKLVLIRHELVSSIVLHSIGSIDFGHWSASLAPVAALAVTALAIIRLASIGLLVQRSAEGVLVVGPLLLDKRL
jgi:hypothetical protein